MNILLIALLAVFGVCVFAGFKKGFLKTAFSLVSWILVLILCNFATPIVTDLLIQHTDIEVVVEATVSAKLNEAMSEALENDGVSQLEAALPAEIKELLLGENESIAELFLSSTGINLAPLVDGIVGILGFVITVIILRIAIDRKSVV